MFGQTASGQTTECTPPPPGILAWWTGDGDSTDIIFANEAILSADVTFAPGFVDQGFLFSGGSVEIVPNVEAPDLFGAGGPGSRARC